MIHDHERVRSLSPVLSRRMAPIAALVFVVIAWLTPHLYQRSLLIDRSIEAKMSAQSLAERYSQLATRAPVFWGYRTRQLSFEANPFIRLGVSLRVDTHLRRSVLLIQGSLQGREGLLDHEEVYGVADVYSGRRLVGRVHLWLPTQHLRERTQGLWLIAHFVALIVAACIFFIPWLIARRGDRVNQDLWSTLKGLNIHLEERVEQRTQELNQLNQRLLRVQEEERARISKNLHDDLGQTLTGLRLQLTTLNVIHSHSMINQLIQTVDLGVEQVRGIAYDLRPPELDALGLKAALSRHLERRTKEVGLTVYLDDLLDDNPPLHQSEILFRVLQEGLTNIIRHANAQRIWVTLSKTSDSYLLSITDDGDGLKDEQALTLQREDQVFETQFGLGLMGLSARVKEAGGVLNIENSSERGGVKLCVTLPF